jgi:hypothetical protein
MAMAVEPPPKAGNLSERQRENSTIATLSAIVSRPASESLQLAIAAAIFAAIGARVSAFTMGPPGGRNATPAQRAST